MRRREKDQGAVLLTTLLVMALMAALAVAIVDDIRFAIKRTANMQAFAQIDWYRQAAEDFAANYVDEVIGQLDNKSDLNAALAAGEPVIFPIDGGMMAFEFRDGSNCFPLSHIKSDAGRHQFVRLLTNLGWSPTDAVNFSFAAKDWQDEDTQISPGGAEDYTYLGLDPAYRTAGADFASVAELRAVQGMTEEEFQILRPYVCAGTGREVALNVNTMTLADTPLLGAILGEDMISRAEECLSSRPSGGYEKASFEACINQNNSAVTNTDQTVVYEPNFIWIEADIQYQQARRTSVFEFAIDSGRAKRTYRRHSAEARRPRLIVEEEE